MKTAINAFPSEAISCYHSHSKFATRRENQKPTTIPTQLTLSLPIRPSMKENVLDVLIYMFENYLFEDGEVEPDQEVLTMELREAGFEPEMVDRAFAWLDSLGNLCDQQNTSTDITMGTRERSPAPPALRHYAPAESQRLGSAARGLLLKLEHCGVLTPRSREMVISQFMALEADSVEIDDLKWVILMVLSNDSASEGVFELTESVVMDGLHSCMH